MPPRPKKRKTPDVQFDDPLQFVARYCEQRAIPFEVGISPVEKECNQLAQEAREDYKSRRDALSARRPADSSPRQDHIDSSLDRKGLSPAQKYTIRLQNNRKSADAAKVYTEVLKREQAYRLASFSDPHHLVSSDVKPFISSSHHAIINSLHQQIHQLQREKKDLDASFRLERQRNDRLNKRLTDLLDHQKDHHHRAQQEHSLRMHHHQIQPQHHHTIQPHQLQQHHPSHHHHQHSQPPQHPHHPQQPQPHHPPHPSPPPPPPPPSSQQQLQHQPHHHHSQQHTHHPHHHPSLSSPPSQPLVHPHMPPSQESHLAPDSQPHETMSSQQMSLPHRLVSRGLLQSWSPSPVPIDSEVKEFHTGLTCSQSQNEDTDDKGQLIRSSLPMSSSLQIGLIGSQPSQTDLPGDLPLADTEFFLGSQGTSKSRAS